MQTVIQVIATGAGSLRNKIMSDPQLEKKFDFIKVWHKQPSRPHGWAKIHSSWSNQPGVARAQQNIDLLRSDKARHQAELNYGDFVDYLLARHQSRILAIHIMRR